MRARRAHGAAIGSLLAICASGCGDDETPRAPTVAPDAGVPTGCAAGEYAREGGSCAKAGLPTDLACAPGEWQPDGAACAPAGVPPDGCAEGFVHDGDGGCDPILPARDCAPGTMAVPGQTECHEPSPCGAGPWGDIPVEASTQHVDASYAGGDGDGSPAKPWTTIGAAILAAESGAIVAVAEGSYAEDVRIEGKSVRLWGNCPALVEIAGTDASLATIVVGQDATGAEVRSLAVRGAGMGIAVVSSEDLLFDSVWVHDTGSRGFDVRETTDAVGATLHGSLVERARETGIRAAGGTLIVSGSVVRDSDPTTIGERGIGVTIEPNPLLGTPAVVTLSGSLLERNVESGISCLACEIAVHGSIIRDTDKNADGIRGWGVHAQFYEGARAELSVVGSVLERNHRFGIDVIASDAIVESSVVRSTQPDDFEFEGGHGVLVAALPEEMVAATLVLRGSLVEDNVTSGVGVIGSTATFEGVLVRRTQPGTDGRAGSGIAARGDPTLASPTTVVIRGSRFDETREAAIALSGVVATIEGTRVRGTQLDADGRYGVGILAQDFVRTGTGTLRISGSLLDENHTAGILVVDTAATVEASEVRGSLPDADGQFGRGIHLESDFAPTSATLVGVLVDSCRDAGVFAFDAHVALDGCLVSRTEPNGSGALGDGLVAVSFDGAASADVTRTRFQDTARAAISTFGGAVTLRDSALACQAFDLAGADYDGHAHSLEDLGGNVCGCPDPDEPCAITSPGGPSLQPIGGLE